MYEMERPFDSPSGSNHYPAPQAALSVSVGWVAPDLNCIRCGRTPEDLSEYQDLADHSDGEYATAYEACWEEEGTLNHVTGLFACTSCYIRLGMPSAPGPRGRRCWAESWY